MSQLDTDIIDELEHDIMEYSLCGNIMLTGDLNARTGTNSDLVDDDDKHLPFDDEYIVDSVPMKRTSLDSIVNSRGKRLLDLCIQSSLHIVNGRFLGDTNGNFTCFKYHGSSVVDYNIVSESLLRKIVTFRVNKFNCLLSDHCQITLSLKINCNKKVSSVNSHEEGLRPLPIKYKWSEKNLSSFQEALVSQDTIANISTFMNSKYDDVEKAEADLTNILLSVADRSLKKKSSPQKIK